MLKTFIGPNGYGKTTALHDEKNDLINYHSVKEEDILFLESEILLSDEVKDTKDSTKTMEYIISEILFNSPTVLKAKNSFEKAVDNVIASNTSAVDAIVNDVLSINGSPAIPTGKSFMSAGIKEYKKLVKIDQKLLLDKTGSGQRMNFILKLVEQSKSKKYVFLDEPEKYSHPSLLNETANIIRNILANGIDVYIATHSPKLLSMLDIDFNNLVIINDSTHAQKVINFTNVIGNLSTIPSDLMNQKHQNYYSVNTLITNIKQIHYSEFLESLFTKKVYVCEGIDDECFIKRYLQHENRYYDDYVIFKTYGKYHMPIFCEIYKQLGIDYVSIFDEDNANDQIHQSLNTYLSSGNHYKFTPNIESEIGYSGSKNDINDLNLYLDIFDFSLKNYF